MASEYLFALISDSAVRWSSFVSCASAVQAPAISRGKRSRQRFMGQWGRLFSLHFKHQGRDTQPRPGPRHLQQLIGLLPGLRGALQKSGLLHPQVAVGEGIGPFYRPEEVLLRDR